MFAIFVTDVMTEINREAQFLEDWRGQGVSFIILKKEKENNKYVIDLETLHCS